MLSDNGLLATVYETESNDTSGTANPVSNGDIVRGSISRVGDRDWFKVTFSGSGPASFSLSDIPYNCDYELCLYDSSVNLVGSSLTPGSVDEYISYNVTANRVYYIQVYSYQGISSSWYTLRINGPSQAHTWYSQVISEGGSFNWSRSKLDNLYFPNMQSCDSCGGVFKCCHTPFWTPAGYSPASNQLSSGHMNTWGCMITAHAMLLRNLGAKTTASRTDFRTDTTGSLLADPFVVTMVNLGWPSISYRNGRYEITNYTSSSSPAAVGNHVSIAAAFGKQYSSYSVDGLSPAEKAQMLVTLIKANPAGVHVRFQRDGSPNSKHSLVFTGLTNSAPAQLPAFPISLHETLLTPENEKQLLGDAWELSSYDDDVVLELGPSSVDTSYDGWFIAYDPASSSTSGGAGIPFSSTYSWGRGYKGMENLIGIMVIK